MVSLLGLTNVRFSLNQAASGHPAFGQKPTSDEHGFDRTYVSGIERGERNPTIEVMQRLADALAVDVRLFA